MAAGKKHTLVIYNRTMDRLWPGVLVLGLELFGLWWFRGAWTSLYRPELDPLLMGAAGYTTALGLFAFLARRMGYVRAFDDFFLVASPFYRFKTSYQRIRGMRAADFHRLFDLEKMSWSEERYVRPMIGATAVVIRLTDYPVPTGLMGTFFHRYLVSPKDTELVLLVPKWMDLSVELDSRYNEYRQRKRRRMSISGFQRGSAG